MAIEAFGLARIGGDTGHAFQQAFGDLVVDRSGCILVQALHQAVAQVAVGDFLAGDTDHAELVGKQAAGREIVQRRDHQPMGEVAGGAEDDEGAGYPVFCCCAVPFEVIS